MSVSRHFSLLLVCSVCFGGFVAIGCRTVPQERADKQTREWSTHWQVDSAVLAAREQQRPEVNYREELVPAYQLPELLIAKDGRAITTSSDWENTRRPEVLNLFAESVYGEVPDPPDSITFNLAALDTTALDGTSTMKQIDITVWKMNESLTIHLTLFLPNAARKPVPVFLLLNNRAPENMDPTRQVKSDFWPAEAVVGREYGIAGFQVSDLDPDHHEGFNNGIHGILDETRTGESWGTLAAWAWGASRAMDYFERDRDIDAARVAVIGHSRGGKTALWAGASDPRFGLVISNNSGAGGAALSRRRFGEKVARINSAFPHWFCENFKSYNDREDDLPVDQHMLLALIAPRPVYVASSNEDLWADPKGEYLSLYHAGEVYALYDLPVFTDSLPPGLDMPVQSGNMAYHIRSGKHDLTLFDWLQYMSVADRLGWRE